MISELGATAPEARAVIGAVRDILGPRPGARGDDLAVLVEETLETTWATPLSPTDFAVLRGSVRAEAAVVVLIVAACLRQGGPTTELVARVAAYADAADAGREWVPILGNAVRGRGFRITLALAARAPDGRRLLGEAWRERGARGVVEALLSALGATPPDRERGWWFKRLGLLAEGTVGRTFWADLTSRGIALPGERGGLPLPAVHHDLMHSLTGYGTDGAGECQLAGFYSGFGYRGWPAWILAALTTFELGLRVGPVFVPPVRGQFDPRRVLAAARRGAAARFDPLDRRWDYASLMPLLLDDAREQLGIRA